MLESTNLASYSFLNKIRGYRLKDDSNAVLTVLF